MFDLLIKEVTGLLPLGSDQSEKADRSGSSQAHGLCSQGAPDLSLGKFQPNVVYTTTVSNKEQEMVNTCMKMT